MPTMTLSYKQFPSGTVLNPIGSIPVSSGEKISLSALSTFSEGAATYNFLFWDANASISTDPAVTFTAPSDNSTFAADAWYVLEGGGGGGTGVVTWAFSQNQHKTLPDTPIASVNIRGAWSGPPSTSVSTTKSSSPVEITALRKISGYGLFTSWLQLGGGTVQGDVLTVPANGACEAIAFFGIPVPDPCQGLRDEMNDFNESDFPSPAAAKAAFLRLEEQLRACEQEYGEM
jgi:hypothetical protein